MKLRVLIPARRFHDAKSRLSPLLSSEERADLARDLLANLLTCVHEASPDAERLVLTNDSEVMELAQEFGAAVRRDDDRADGRVAHAVARLGPPDVEPSSAERRERSGGAPSRTLGDDRGARGEEKGGKERGERFRHY